MLVHIVQKLQFDWVPFTFIKSLHIYYQPLDVLSVESCVWDFYIVSTMDVLQKFFFIDW